MKASLEKKMDSSYHSSYGNYRDGRRVQEPTISINGYIFDVSEMRARIQQIEKELSETRDILYGKQNGID